MDSQRFDALTRWLGGAGSRRRVLSSLAAGTVAQVLRRSSPDEVAAACKGYNAKCKSSSSCCAGPGLRCEKQGKKGKKSKKRCRCKNGWKRCDGAGAGCLNVQTDVDNCGDCDHQCPAQTPCCFGGECQELCGNGLVGETCCADCFVLITGDGVPPAPNSDECCPADRICGPNPKKLSDDRCCLTNEECVDGECCNNTGALGSVVCGGKCCANGACHNGQCCGQGKVWETTPEGVKCVSANRTCDSNPDCHSSEVCHGGVCCSGERICSMGLGANVCCAADERCELPGTQFAACCPINTTCNTYKPHRVRR